MEPMDIYRIFQLLNTSKRLIINRENKKEVNRIIDKYELEYCRSASEFRTNLSYLSAREKTFFYKIHPWIEEYLEAAKKGFSNYRPPK